MTSSEELEEGACVTKSQAELSFASYEMEEEANVDADEAPMWKLPAVGLSMTSEGLIL